MEYYSSKYPRMTVEHLPGNSVKIVICDKKLEFVTPRSSDYTVDIVVRDNKIYKITKANWLIKEEQVLSDLISFLTIKAGFILESSRSGKVVLKSLDDDDRVYINTDNEVRLVEYVQVDVLDSAR